jgi:tetraacyldisaccharide 4'-kinase
LSGIARSLKDFGIVKGTRLDTRVVSVGNIQVGGAGKTPLVAQIAREAAQRKLRVCILTRGYKSKWESEGGILFPGTSEIDPSLCGDEAALLHELCPEAWIGVGADRVKQFHDVAREVANHQLSKIDLVILDDGFQHWRIQKDLDIVALTSAKTGEVLFREGFQALKQADLLVWTKGEACPLSPESLASLGKPMIRVRYQIPQAPKGDSQQGYWLVTGIADSQSALELIRKSGYDIKRQFELKDHAHYEKAWVKNLLRDSRQQNSKIALTGKDWVKWKSLGVSSQEVLVLEPQLVFEEGQEIWLKTLWGE